VADCIVVGGGVVGLLTASVLADAGAEVLLFDRGALDDLVDPLSTGVLSPLYPWREEDAVNDLLSYSQESLPDFVNGLTEYTAIDSELVQSGLLVLNPDDPQQALAWSDRYDIEADCLHGEVIGHCAPGVSSDAQFAVYLPDVMRLNCRAFQRALLETTERQGVQVWRYAEVCGLARGPRRVTGVVTAHGVVEAEQVVVCAGIWTTELLRALQTPIVVDSIPTQMLQLCAGHALPRQNLVVDDCCITANDHEVLICSTGELIASKPAASVNPDQPTLARVYAVLPAIESCRTQRRWFGRRPLAPGGVPYVGIHPELEGLFVNTGHFDLGFVFGLVSAHMLLDLMTNQPPILPPEPFALERAG